MFPHEPGQPPRLEYMVKACVEMEALFLGSYEMDPLEAITMLALTNALMVNCFLFYYLEGEVYAVEKKPPGQIGEAMCV